MTAQDSLSGRAREARDQLFTRYDRLNDLWKQVEERLTKYHIPREVTYTYASYHPDEECEHYGVKQHAMLCLRKVQGEWRVCHGSYDDRWPDEEHWTPISECSALIRVQAVKHLPGLEEKIVSSTEGFIPLVDESIQHLTGFLSPRPGDEIRNLLAERAKFNGKES